MSKAERRSLMEGLKPVDRSLEESFVFKKPGAAPPELTAAAPPAADKSPVALGRAPLTTRIRADFAAALKRASLERQLSCITPNTVQEILEEALEPWFKANGYLT